MDILLFFYCLDILISFIHIIIIIRREGLDLNIEFSKLDTESKSCNSSSSGSSFFLEIVVVFILINVVYSL